MPRQTIMPTKVVENESQDAEGKSVAITTKKKVPQDSTPTRKLPPRACNTPDEIKKRRSKKIEKNIGIAKAELPKSPKSPPSHVSTYGNGKYSHQNVLEVTKYINLYKENKKKVFPKKSDETFVFHLPLENYNEENFV